MFWSTSARRHRPGTPHPQGQTSNQASPSGQCSSHRPVFQLGVAVFLRPPARRLPRVGLRWLLPAALAKVGLPEHRDTQSETARRLALLLACALWVLTGVASAQSAANVLLVVNDASPESKDIGDYYARARQIDTTHIVHLTTPVTDGVSREVYAGAIEAPIGRWLAKHLLQDQILYIVLTKGVPLRIEGSGGQNGTIASVDSELTLLYRRMTGVRTQVTGRTDNPYFLGERPVADAKRFTRMASDIYLVSRLDGFTVADVKALIDRGLKPARDGQIVLDQRATSVDRGGDAWLAEAANRLGAAGQTARVTLEGTRAIATATGPVLGYFSWGSNDPANQLRKTGLTFANGAIGGEFVSTDGRTFREPTTEWRPAPAGATTGGQSLAADLIRDGLTGVTAHVSEPYLDAIARPQILFPAYLGGFGLVEAYYLAMPFVSWQNIVVGDPLVAPFQTAPLSDAEIHHGMDDALALPKLFGERLMASLKATGLKPDALALGVRADSLTAQGRPDEEVLPLLERATALEPRLAAAQLRLATAAELRGDTDAAIGRYRAILAVEPNNPIALNNLAYSLADKKGDAKAALPLAEQAYKLTGQSATVADTLGWVHYKLGDHAAALPLLERAAKAAPTSADIQIHAAFVHAALGNLPAAKTYLDAALKLDPKLGERADVKELQGRIK